MRRTTLVAALAALAIVANAQLIDHKAQARDMLRVIDKYHAKTKKAGLRPLRVIYLVPSDKQPLKDYQARVQRVVEDIQAFYRHGMELNGFGPTTFDIERDTAGKLVIHVVNGARKGADYHYEGGGDVVWKEAHDALAKEGIDTGKETILLMTVNAVEEGTKLHFDAPFYGSGSAHGGTGWVLNSSWLDPLNFADKTTAMDDGQAKLSLGRFNTKWIGGTAHELGHGFGLPHNRETDAEKAALGTALMGSGNHTYKQELRGEGKGSFLTFASAMRLASHPCFTHSERDVDIEPSARYEDLKLEVDGKDVVATGRVRAKVPPYGAIVYNDPDGGSDYDAVHWESTVDGKGRFKVRVMEIKPGKGEFRLTVCFANGATDSRSFPYAVDANGKITIGAEKQ